MGQERLGPSHCFIPLVPGPLNSLVWYVPSLRYTRGLGWRIHCGEEVTESSTNKQHHHHHGDGAPGAGAEDFASARRFWRVEFGRRSRRRPTRRRVFPAPLFLADSVWLSVGWISCWTLSVGWTSMCGRDVRGQRQVFLNAGSRGIFDRCFSTPLHALRHGSIRATVG